MTDCHFDNATNTYGAAHSDYCLKDAASAAYAETCAPYHSWAVKTAAYAGMYALPTRDQLLVKLNETGKLIFYRYRIISIIFHS